MIENSNAYQVWVHDQLEPDDKLIVGRKIKREKPRWMLKGEAKEHPTEQELLEKEKEFLLKHGMDF